MPSSQAPIVAQQSLGLRLDRVAGENVLSCRVSESLTGVGVLDQSFEGRASGFNVINVNQTTVVGRAQ